MLRCNIALATHGRYRPGPTALQSGALSSRDLLRSPHFAFTSLALMIGLLVVAHGHLGESLIECASYVLGQRPVQLAAIDLMAFRDPGVMHAEAQRQIAELDQGQGVLVLADVYGATPCNTVCRLLSVGRVEVVVGANVPMLLKTLTYRDRGTLEELAERAAHGAREGVFRMVQECVAHARA